MRVTAKNARTWTVFYRNKNGRQKRLTLGCYPAVKLVDARELAREPQRKVAHGGDPGDGQWRISIAGGEQPWWRGDGMELFFVGADGKMMSVAVSANTEPKLFFRAEGPEPLFDAHMLPTTTPQFEYDVSPDGKRFLINSTSGNSASAPYLNVVVNWDTEVKK